MTRVLLADDQAEVREGMRALLEPWPDLEVVGEACDGAAAVALARRRRSDVVVMDIRMPVMDGLAATRALTAVGEAKIDVLVVTTFDLDEYVFEALQSGAAGFLPKHTLPETLVPGVRAVAAGHGLVAAEVTRRLISEYAAVAPPVQPDDTIATLTARELEVLQLVVRGLTNAEIAAMLVVEENTVKSHVTAILSKLGLRSRVQAVIFAYEQGLARVGRGR
jgi:DNA-binding NarL/FixJ family response regulator